MSQGFEVIRIPPFSYLHVTNSNTNVTRVITGPATHTCMDDEVVVLGPVEMVALPPRHFCIVSNPVVTDESGVVFDTHGQAKLRHGDREVRLDRDYPDPFPLYPGEELTPSTLIPLQVVPEGTALRLRATRDFTDTLTDPNGAPVPRSAGEEWLFRGHRTYYPQIEVEILDTLKAVVLLPNQALRVQARNPMTDASGTERNAGEEWLIFEEGAYLPGAEEIVVGVVNAVVLSDKTALHLRAAKDFVDVYGEERKTGDEWLVTKAMRESHIPGVAEDVVGVVDLVTLAISEYAVVADPVDPESGVPAIGAKILKTGPDSFFLQPGETLETRGFATVLGEEEALLVTARHAFTDDTGVDRVPGSRWLVYGPQAYIPPIGVEMVARKRALIHIEGWFSMLYWINV